MNNKAVPLCVDLDGTLINTDMLHESLVYVIKKEPLLIIGLIFKLIFNGKAGLKRWVASKYDFDASTLPYNEDFLSFLKLERQKGRSLILCTASDNIIAIKIANYLSIFDEVISSDGLTNLSGINKADFLVKKFGKKSFDYAGNSNIDLDVWKFSNNAIIVNASNNTKRRVKKICNIENIFELSRITFRDWVRALRIHQWLKNTLIFVPFLAAYQLSDASDWGILLLAFLSFSLCASSVYLINDLLDLESDRKHPRKRNRPFAKGLIPIYLAIITASIILIISFVVASFVGSHFLKWLAFYLFLTFIYSFKLKQLVIVDSIILAILYTLRMVAGASAVDISLSFWLLAFSIFLFLSLAFVKRYAELKIQSSNSSHKVHGRGYYIEDLNLIQSFGVSSGFMSVFVWAFYINSPEIQVLYARPEWVWGNIPVILFWISWLWLRAGRGEMHDDPIIFAVKDKVSLISGMLFISFLFLGVLKI